MNRAIAKDVGVAMTLKALLGRVINLLADPYGNVYAQVLAE